MGHSVKRKEDPRFIRGAGEYIDDVNLPGQLWLDIVRSPYAHATIKGIDSSEALKVPGVLAVITGKDLEGYKLHWMPTLAGDMQMVLPDRHGHVPEPGGRRGHRDVALRGGRRRRRGPRRLRAAAGRHRSVQGARGRRARCSGLTAARASRTTTSGTGNPAMPTGRRGPRRLRGPGQGAHLHPAHPRRLDRDVWLRRRLGSDPQPADAAHDVPGAARHPDGRRPGRRRGRPAHLRAEHPGQDPRHRGRIRRQGAGLSGLRPGGRRLVPHRQAGQVDRGPLREPPGGLVRPRLPHRHRGRRDQGGPHPGDEGQDDRRPRLHRCRGRSVEVPGRPVQRHHRLVRLRQRVRRGRRRLHEQAARRRRVPLLVPRHRGGPRRRADRRRPRPRDRQGPGAAPDGELHPARAVPVQDADRLGVRLGRLPARPAEGARH